MGVHLREASPVLTNFEANYNSPTPIFEDNKGTRDMLEAQHVTSNFKHMDIPLRYVHEEHEYGDLVCLPCSSENMFVDTITKQETGPKHLLARKWYAGHRFHPPVNSQHYMELTKSTPLS